MCRLTSSGLLAETSAWNATPAAKRQKISECDIMLICVSKHSLKDSEQAMELQNLVTESKQPCHVYTVEQFIQYAHYWWVFTLNRYSWTSLSRTTISGTHLKCIESISHSWTSLSGILGYLDNFDWLLKIEKIGFDCIFLCMNALWKV